MYRRATSSDVEALVALMAENYSAEGYPFEAAEARAAFAALIADGQLGSVWAAEVGGVLVAYVAVTLGYTLEYGGRDAFIDDLYVAPAHRNRGLGRAGLAVAEAECETLDVRVLHLEVERHKDATQALYRRCGFNDQGRQLMSKRILARSVRVARGENS